MKRALMLCVLVVVCSLGVLAQSEPLSPTLRLLARNNSPAALGEFWAATEQSGAPVIEPMAGDATHDLVTFLWRNTPDTRTVALVATISSHLLEPLVRLDGTDVWYFSTPVQANARFAYRLAVNGPMTTEGPQVSELLRALQPDPLNHRRWACPNGTDARMCQSAVEMPGAPAQPWIRVEAGTPKGLLSHGRFRSATLRNERTVTVYTPAGYADDATSCDLLIVFDEGAYLNLVPTPTILDNLIAAKRIRPTVAVFLGNPSADTRTAELRVNPVFADMLARELVPWIHQLYRVTSDPTHVTLAGSSFGGLMAAYAAFRHSETFGNVLCQSGDFSWAPDHQHEMGHLADASTETGWLAKQFIASPKLPIRFYMDAGTFEADQFGTGGMILETSRDMRDVLLAKGYEVTYQQFAGGHDYLSWRGTFSEGLLALVGTKR